MTDSDQNKRLALAVRSLANLRREFCEVKRDYTSRIEILQNEISSLSEDICSGQERLKLEQPDGTPDQPTEGEK